jgi:hypothetical protein
MRLWLLLLARNSLNVLLGMAMKRVGATPETSKQYQRWYDDKGRPNQQNQPVSGPQPSIALWVTPQRK